MQSRPMNKSMTSRNTNLSTPATFVIFDSFVFLKAPGPPLSRGYEPYKYPTHILICRCNFPPPGVGFRSLAGPSFCIGGGASSLRALACKNQYLCLGDVRQQGRGTERPFVQRSDSASSQPFINPQPDDNKDLPYQDTNPGIRQQL